MALKTYWKKRQFDVTPEPRGKPARGSGDRYVIQKHAATRLHYDLRLELGGVMKSWAVTRGPSLVPGEKRLAVHVEDHPIEYNSFEGTIPKGQYGGGTVMIWDRGTWTPVGDAERGYNKGHLEFVLDGEKLHGRWHLVRMRKRTGERQDPWLLIKADDEQARRASDPDILEEMPRSVASERSLSEISEGRAAHKRTKAAKDSPARGSSRAGNRKSSSRAQKNPGIAPPAFVEPCLAKLENGAPAGKNWVHELKFDGYRVQARLLDGKVTLKTRKGLDWTKRFQSIADAVAELPASAALLDGEIVVENERGVPEFSSLQADLSEGRTDRFIYYAFDLLHLDGSELAKLPLLARKTALENLLKRTRSPVIRYSAHVDEPGPVVLKHACQMGLEGIVSKRADLPYHSGRAGDWVKSKCANRQEFVVVGYVPSTAAKQMIGSLAVGYFEGGVLRYAGRVGTGFTQKTARDLWTRLQPLRVEKRPFPTLPADLRDVRSIVWVVPKLVIEADFGNWTADRILRHAVFKGVREDKSANDVVLEMPMPAPPTNPPAGRTGKGRSKSAAAAPARTASSNGAGQDVQLTHPDRVYWDDVGVTKQDLADYYREVWDWMAPHVARRPLALLRCPDGVSGQCFFQKQAHATFNQGHILRSRDGKDEILSIEDVGGLVALAQAGVLEIHVWGSTVEAVDRCDRLVFDLDPGPGVAWPDVIKAVREVRARLQDYKLESFVKTTGGKGFHVVVPLAGVDWDTAKAFTYSIARQMEADAPSRYVSTITKSKRQGRIFVDYLRNTRGATAVCAFSTRARAGAAVSTPIAWEELTPALSANKFSVLNLRQRLSRLRRDPWKDMAKLRQKLPANGRSKG